MDNLQIIDLPDRQAEALRLTALGYTRKQAAKILRCTPDNVAKLMQAVLCRLNAKNTPQAITIAFQRGILRFLTAILTISGCTFILPTTADADSDPLVRRLSNRIPRRGTRRVSNGLPKTSTHTQLYIDTFGLEPVLTWDDEELIVQYLPSSATQTQPAAHVFSVDDLMTWHSEQFFQSFNQDASHE